jgi:predicted nucleic acid-binding protein
MSALFVDTSALLALLHGDDAHHAPVRSLFEQLARDRVPLVTHSYILVEAGALVRKRHGVEMFRRLGDTVRRAADIVWVDPETHVRAWDLAGDGGRKGPGLVDQVSFLVMRNLGLDAAATLDRHFAEQGFRILPGE